MRVGVQQLLLCAVAAAGLGGGMAFLTSSLPMTTWARGPTSHRGAPVLRVRAVATAQGAATNVPSAGELFIADWLGIRTKTVARESRAWSHASYTNQSLILQLSAQIEEQGGQAAAAARDLVAARRSLFHALLRHDYNAYIRAATSIGGLIDRRDLPNVERVPHPSRTLSDLTPQPVDRALLGGQTDLVPDCTLPNITFVESPLDRALLFIFRGLVQKETGYRSSKEGILGLLEEGREYMLRPQQTAEAQHKMVYNTLAGLLTPVMPPIYRTFMSGTYWQSVLGQSFGPWPWAAALTAFITPTFFGFLVGPSRPNRRQDGSLGGLVVEKCKYLQESGCKGLCLNQCKLPAQQFFSEGLGLALTVKPNFETQECQWSFGETPLPPKEDPLFPQGCLAGCPTRAALREAKQSASCS